MRIYTKARLSAASKSSGCSFASLIVGARDRIEL
jgi:hypothetical protein